MTVALCAYASTFIYNVLKYSVIDAGSQFEPNVEGIFKKNTHDDSEADAERGSTKGTDNIVKRTQMAKGETVFHNFDLRQ
jgi:hypothetical protein